MEQEDAAIRTSMQEQAAAILAEIAALQVQVADSTSDWMLLDAVLGRPLSRTIRSRLSRVSWLDREQP